MGEMFPEMGKDRVETADRMRAELEKEQGSIFRLGLDESGRVTATKENLNVRR